MLDARLHLGIRRVGNAVRFLSGIRGLLGIQDQSLIIIKSTGLYIQSYDGCGLVRAELRLNSRAFVPYNFRSEPSSHLNQFHIRLVPLGDLLEQATDDDKLIFHHHPPASTSQKNILRVSLVNPRNQQADHNKRVAELEEVAPDTLVNPWQFDEHAPDYNYHDSLDIHHVLHCFGLFYPDYHLVIRENYDDLGGNLISRCNCLGKPRCLLIRDVDETRGSFIIFGREKQNKELFRMQFSMTYMEPFLKEAWVMSESGKLMIYANREAAAAVIPVLRCPFAEDLGDLFLTGKIIPHWFARI